MRRAIATLLLLTAAGILAMRMWSPTASAPQRAELILDDVTVLGPTAGRSAHRRLVVREGRIDSIGPASRIEARERFVLPGLVDLHVHLPPRLAPGLVDLFALLFLAHGVTGIREVGSLDGQVFEIAREIERGDRVGPRVFGCGPILDGDPPTWPVARVVRTRADGEAAVRQIAARGARCVKVYEGVSPEALAGIRSAANELRLPVLGHLPAALPLADLPLDDVQHLCYTRCASASPEELEEFVERSAKLGVAHTPTLVVFEGQTLLADRKRQASDLPYGLMPRFWRDALWSPIVQLSNPDALASMQGLVRRLHARGVRIHVGTDPIQPYVVPGASLQRELELLVASGLSIEEALAEATGGAGDALASDGLGHLVIGAPADLLILREDPTRDLAALRTLEAVVADGRLYPIAWLQAALEEQRRYFERTGVDLAYSAVGRITLAIARRSFARTHDELTR